MSVADRVLSNSDLEKLVETSDEWIVSRTGIKERRISGVDQGASYFGERAAREALSRAGVDPVSLDAVIVSSVTGDHIFPSVSCLIQDRIGATNAAAFDVGAACAGFIYGLEVGSSMIKSGSFNNALVIGVDVLTKFVDWTDRSTCILFGDGGGAVYLEASDEDRGVIATVMKSDGSGAKHIHMKAGGALNPSCMPLADGMSPYLFMAGQEVYRFAVKAMGDSCRSVLEKAGLSVDDVDLFVPHQANLRIITAASDRLGLPPEKVYVNVEKYGNMSAGSIPVALYEAEADGTLMKGDLVMTVGFGAGLVWGANLIRW
ncbi:MAG: ketoacyl-ACP synthase III [Armatimonadota bacterium]|nr:ketoacyl-ACP synthase III [Armatimonadota bacterium]